VANRRITQFPSIEATDIVDDDLITLVQVFEIDPALRNKKLEFSGLRTYLDQFYLNITDSDPFIAGNVIVSGYAIVSGNLTSESNFFVSGDATFANDVSIGQNLSVDGNIDATGNINANQINVLNVVTEYLEATSGNFTIATGTTADFVSGFFDVLSGNTITGETLGFVNGSGVNLTIQETLISETGIFNDLTINELVISGITIADDVNVDNLNASGTISGATITGDLIQGTSGEFEILNVTNQATIQNLEFNFASGVSGVIDQLTVTDLTLKETLNTTGTISGATITGDLIQGTSGEFQVLNVTDQATVENLNVTFISGESGVFQEFSGETITGNTINATLINVHTLAAVELQFSGDQEISGDLTLLENFYVLSGGYFGGPLIVTGLISGETITGQSGTFDTIVSAPTITGQSGTFSSIVSAPNITGQSGTFDTIVSAPNISGGLGTFTGVIIDGDITVSGSIINPSISGDVIIDGSLQVSGDTSISGNLSITSGNINGDGSTDLTNIDQISFNSGLIISGAQLLSGQFSFPWGSETVPSITFTGDENTGFYNEGDKVSTSLNASKAWTIESGTGSSAGRYVLTIWNA